MLLGFSLAFLLGCISTASSTNTTGLADFSKSGINTAGSIVVDRQGTTFSYIESGAPRRYSYTTVFLVHGLGFTSSIFQKVIASSASSNLRIVAVSRRNYPGSTGYTSEEISILTNGTDAQKSDFLKTTGIQLSTFIDKFTTQHNLPPISGNNGGIAILGWSLGNAFTLASLANADALASDAKSRLQARLRAVIMLEPPSIVLGLNAPPQTWSPHTDSSISPALQTPLFTNWITSYFKHGDITKSDPNLLSYVVPDFLRTPSIYSMTPQQVSHVVFQPAADPTTGPDFLFMIKLVPQFLTQYKKALYDKTLRGLFPNMKVWMVTGDATASFSLAAMFSMKIDDKAAGGNNVKYKVVSGTNHFIHWDHPTRFVHLLHTLIGV
ncbi:hypothetical protein BDN72DRAFT_893921 [Pluteus cervinus]|uniref:Uncharacterized protein n=1 Tax=Pluteus cervinus TaxID=181527 RepID=A0ACD3B6G6_9AGAR|nr:hypothetical protein BDN72DRAFT_893921 [Pluteus cervinus]